MLEKLKQSVLVLYLALGDRRTPWYVKTLLVFIVAYLLSPIDVIPDVIPVLGYLDDIILVPIMIRWSFALIPEQQRQELEQQAQQMRLPDGKFKIMGLLIVLVVWIVIAAVIWRLLSD